MHFFFLKNFSTDDAHIHMKHDVNPFPLSRLGNRFNLGGGGGGGGGGSGGQPMLLFIP